MSEHFAGMTVIESPLCERKATPSEDARRIVRHGMSDVLDWLGEPVGDLPGEPVRTVYIVGGNVIASPHTVMQIRGAFGATA